MKRKTAALFLVLGWWVFFPMGSRANPTGDPVTLTFQEKGGHFDIQSRFEVQANPEIIWNTLTDFESYPKFSHELKKVKIQEKSKDHLVIVEEAESGVLFFTQKVFFLLDVKETPKKSFVSTDRGHKSFVSYQSRWEIHPNGSGQPVELAYHLQAEGHFGGPAFLVNDTFKGGIKNFLEAMRKEILRRQSQGTQ